MLQCEYELVSHRYELSMKSQQGVGLMQQYAQLIVATSSLEPSPFDFLCRVRSIAVTVHALAQPRRDNSNGGCVCLNYLASASTPASYWAFISSALRGRGCRFGLILRSNIGFQMDVTYLYLSKFSESP